MSTQLLSVLGKIHELRDDLESHFFVMLYNGLHFVKHDKPSGINVGFIFDHGEISVGTGAHRGGVGKVWMYLQGLDNVNFTSVPLTTLVREVFRLFKTLNLYVASDGGEIGTEPPQNVKKLKNCAEIKKLFANARKSDGWPSVLDKVGDQYPHTDRLTPEGKDTVALSYANRNLSVKSSAGKRKAGKEVMTFPEEGGRNKRSKVASPQ